MAPGHAQCYSRACCTCCSFTQDAVQQLQKEELAQAFPSLGRNPHGWLHRKSHWNDCCKCTDSCHLPACSGRFLILEKYRYYFQCWIIAKLSNLNRTKRLRPSFIFVSSPITLTEDVHLMAAWVAPWLERASIKQLTTNGRYNKLRGRISTVILTFKHHWNLWVQGGQLLKMSVPLSIFIPPCFVTFLCHLLTTCAAFWCFVSSSAKADEVSLTLCICFTSVTVTPYEALESVCSLLLSLMYFFHVRRPFCLWGSESKLMLKTHKTNSV